MVACRSIPGSVNADGGDWASETYDDRCIDWENGNENENENGFGDENENGSESESVRLVAE